MNKCRICGEDPGPGWLDREKVCPSCGQGRPPGCFHKEACQAEEICKRTPPEQAKSLKKPPIHADLLTHAPYAVDPRTPEDLVVCEHCEKRGTTREIMEDPDPCPVMVKRYEGHEIIRRPAEPLFTGEPFFQTTEVPIKQRPIGSISYEDLKRWKDEVVEKYTLPQDVTVEFKNSKGEVVGRTVLKNAVMSMGTETPSEPTKEIERGSIQIFARRWGKDDPRSPSERPWSAWAVETRTGSKLYSAGGLTRQEAVLAAGEGAMIFLQSRLAMYQNLIKDVEGIQGKKETPKMERGFKTWYDQHVAWSERTFGPASERGPEGPVDHLRKEVEELARDPKDLEEVVDCVHLAVDANWRSGHTFEELIEAIYQNVLSLDWLIHLDGLFSRLRMLIRVLVQNPRDLSRIAEALVVSAAIAQRHGHTLQDLLEMLFKKQAKNIARKWPDWRTAPKGKAIEHVRGPEEA